MKYFYCIAVICLFNSHQVYSQKISFGKVSLEELKMTVYERDSAAGAVILSDIGELDGVTLKFTRHMRVKILKKSGLDWGNWIFNVPNKGEFKVLVFNFIDGQLIKDKANSNTIYNEEVVNRFDVYKVFAPNVKVGSVIDIEYSHFGLPYEWRFQERIPVAFSQLTLWDNPRVTYSKTHFGFEPIETVTPNQWRASDVPAFKIEPFLSSYSNYITKFQFQVESFGVAGRYNVDFSSSWRKIIDALLDIPEFGGVLNGSAFLNDFAKETKIKNISIEEKINEAFNYVQTSMKWNGTMSLFATSGLKNNFVTNHSGNSAEINLSLVALLNKMDITAYPIVLSTRENGLLVQHSPTMNKLNYVIAYVRHEGVEIFLDATSENISPGMLPIYCLNGQGLMVKRQNEQWLTLNRNQSDIKKQFVTISISDDGSAKAKINQELKGYAFVNWAEGQKVNNDDIEIHKNKLQNENPEIEILSYEINKKDIKSVTAKETIVADVTNQIVETDNGMIFNPFVMFDYASNSLKSEQRRCPVDMIFPKEINTVVVVQVPKEFSVKRLPESIKFSNPDGSASFTYLANATVSGLQFKAMLKLNKHIFTETEYMELRRFFSEVAKKINEPLELAKK